MRSNLVQDFIGKDIREDFIIEDTELGRAAMGCTVRGLVKKKTGQRYAVKSFVLQNKSKAEKRVRQMLRTEIDLLRSLDHPNIIRPYQTYESDTEFHLVMELCTGLDLGDRCFRDWKAREVVRKLCNVIAYCHSRGVCHRDLKTENILFDTPDEGGEIKLIDFGMSRRFVEGLAMSERLGTPYCMAPEVLSGEYTEKCDMWSIGVITYRMLTGRNPFNGKTDGEIIENMLSLKWGWPPKPKVHPDAKQFVGGLLKLRPNQRWSANRALLAKWLTANPYEERQGLTPAESLERLYLTKKPSRRLSNLGLHKGTIWEQRLTPSKSFSNSMVKAMRNYSEYGLFQRTALMMLAYELSPAKLRALRHAFVSFDTEMNGVISRQELSDALRTMKVPEEEIEKFYQSMDHGRDGQINYCEFLAATVQAIAGEGGLAMDQLAELFDRFDSDKSGAISQKNLADILGETYTRAEVEAVLNEADIKKDGQIDFEEFCTIMKPIHDKKIEEEATKINDMQNKLESGTPVPLSPEKVKLNLGNLVKEAFSRKEG